MQRLKGNCCLATGGLQNRLLVMACLSWLLAGLIPVQAAEIEALPPPAPAPAPHWRSGSSNTASPQHIDNLLRQGMLRESQGQRSQAESIFHQVLSLDPHNANAYFNLGVLLEKQGDLHGALYNYRRAATINPGEVDFRQAVISVESSMQQTAPIVTVHHGPPAEVLTNNYVRPVNAVTMNPQRTSPPAREQQTPSKRSKVTRAVLTTMFAVGAAAALSAATGRGGGGLHCPMCRVLRGGF